MQATEFFVQVRRFFPRSFAEDLRDEVILQLEEFSDQQRHDGMRRLRQTKLGKQSITMADVRQAIEGKAMGAAAPSSAPGEFTYAKAFLDWLRPSKTETGRWDVYKRLDASDQVRISRLAACWMMETPDWRERMEAIGGAGTFRERFDRMAAYGYRQPCCDTVSQSGWFPGRPLIEVDMDAVLPPNVPFGEVAIREEMAAQTIKLNRPPIWGPNKSITHNPWDVEKQPPPVSQGGASDGLKALVAGQRRKEDV